MSPEILEDHNDVELPTKEEQGQDATSIQSAMYYLERTPLYDTEKPYSIRYHPAEPIPQTNYKKIKHPVTFKSMRQPDIGPFKINECGFEIIKLESKLSYDEFWDNEKVQEVYLEEVKEALKRELDAKYVHVLDYAVRKRHESFPVSTGEEYDYDQPTALAHIDFTAQEGKRIINVLFGERAGEVLRGRWQAVNVWKPIKGPLNDWPLGLCDARSVDFQNDTLAGDIVFDDFVTENLQIMHNPDSQWYYLPDHNTWEALIFKSADSEESAAPSCPHSGFLNPKVQKGDFRESLDLRCFVFFQDLDEYPPVVGNVFQAHTHVL